MGNDISRSRNCKNGQKKTFNANGQSMNANDIKVPDLHGTKVSKHQSINPAKQQNTQALKHQSVNTPEYQYKTSTTKLGPVTVLFFPKSPAPTLICKD